MINTLKRSVLSILAEDNHVLTGPEKDACKTDYELKYLKKTMSADFWEHNLWQYTSMYELFDSDPNWYLQHVKLYKDYNPDPQQLPIITIDADISGITSYASIPSVKGILSIQVLCDSAADHRRIDNISGRLIKLLHYDTYDKIESGAKNLNFNFTSCSGGRDEINMVFTFSNIHIYSFGGV